MKTYECFNCQGRSDCSQCPSFESFPETISYESINHKAADANAPTMCLPVGNQPSANGSVATSLSYQRVDPSLPVDVTVNSRVKCSATTKKGRACLDSALPGSQRCINHVRLAPVVFSHSSESKFVQCRGITKLGWQCSNTAKAGFCFCRNHFPATKAPPAIRATINIIVRCRGNAKSGARCQDTAKTGSQYCRNHPSPPAATHSDTNIVYRCRGSTQLGRCRDTAKAESKYCRKHTAKPKDVPSKTGISQCNGSKADGERCSDTARLGSLYCWNHSSPVPRSTQNNALVKEISEPTQENVHGTLPSTSEAVSSATFVDKITCGPSPVFNS